MSFVSHMCAQKSEPNLLRDLFVEQQAVVGQNEPDKSEPLVG